MFCSILVLLIIFTGLMAFPDLKYANAQQASPSYNTIPVDGTNFTLNYSITGGNVTDASIHVQAKSLTILISATKAGTVTFQIPRALIDAKTSSGQDGLFLVLIDGAEVQPQSEVSSTDYRTVTTSFLQGEQNVEIIGSQAVPEFGPIVSITFVVAVASIIMISFRTRYNSGIW